MTEFFLLLGMGVKNTPTTYYHCHFIKVNAYPFELSSA